MTIWIVIPIVMPSHFNCHTESYTGRRIVLPVHSDCLASSINSLIESLASSMDCLASSMDCLAELKGLSCQQIRWLFYYLNNRSNRSQSSIRKTVQEQRKAEAEKYIIFSLLKSRSQFLASKVKSKPLEIIILLLCNYLADQNP